MCFFILCLLSPSFPSWNSAAVPICATCTSTAPAWSTTLPWGKVIITSSPWFYKIQVLENANNFYFAAFYHVCSELWAQKRVLGKRPLCFSKIPICTVNSMSPFSSNNNPWSNSHVPQSHIGGQKAKRMMWIKSNLVHLAQLMWDLHASLQDPKETWIQLIFF